MPDVQAYLAAVFGRSSSPEQKMNLALKSNNAERIDILYGLSLEQVRQTYAIGDQPVLVWRRGDADWVQRVDAIEPRPGVGRAPRPSYFLDIRRCSATKGEMDELEAKLSEGLLVFARVPVDELPKLTRADLELLRLLAPTGPSLPLFEFAVRYVRSQGK